MANEKCCVVSPSLINSVKTDLNKLNKTGFNLGMDEWISDLPDLDADVENEAPPQKKLRLSLSHGRKNPLQPTNRFSKPVGSPERLKAAKGVVPLNTESSTQ